MRPLGDRELRTPGRWLRWGVVPVVWPGAVRERDDTRHGICPSGQADHLPLQRELGRSTV